MKKIFWGLSAVITASIIVIACQKQDSVRSNNSKDEFDATAAKEWYYGTFKKSAEWQSSSEKGKKLPDWKNPELSKIGNREIIVYPLIEGKKKYAISSTGSNKMLSQEQLKRIAAASITRIAFIKQPSGKIVTREIEYIPDWNYLQARNFDISKVNILGNNNGFSGRVIVKNWEGKIISMALLDNGKTIKRGTRKLNGPDNKVQANNVTSEQCFEQEFCVWQMDCTLYIYSDGMITEECSAWYNTGECWTETWCEDGGDPCELAGIGCGGDEGGGEPCANAEEEFNSIVASGTPISEDDGIVTISEIYNTRTKSYKWKFFQIGGPISTVTYTSTETGTHINDPLTGGGWKWQSLTHNSISKNGNSYLWSSQCSNLVATPSFTNIPLIGTPFSISYGTMDLAYDIQVNYSCGVAIWETNDSYTSNKTWNAIE